MSDCQGSHCFCRIRYRDAEAKLSLYESSPSEPEVMAALKDAERDTPEAKMVPCLESNKKVLARALRSCQAKLAEAELENRENMAQARQGVDRMIERAEKAESEIAELRKKICKEAA